MSPPLNILDWKAMPRLLNGPLRNTRAFLPAMLLVLIAGWQFYHVRTAGWNRWRGGGFGMYAGFHPRHSEAWVWRTGAATPTRVIRDGAAEGPFEAALQHCLARPNQTCLRQALRHAAPGDSVLRLQVWCLDFEPSSRVVSRRLLVELAREPAE